MTMTDERKNPELVDALSQPGKADRRSKRKVVFKHLSDIISSREDVGKAWEEISIDIFKKERILIKPKTIASYVSKLRPPRRAAALADKAPSKSSTGIQAIPARPTQSAPSETQVKGEIRAVTPRRPR